MLDAFATIANGGVTRPPHLLDATIDADGVRHGYHGSTGVRVVSAATAGTMTNMMRGVVANGTGVCAAIPGYPVAGKTGTSKKLQADGTYSDTSTMASFIGFAPADNPRFAAIVVLDSPAYDFQFGGASAAPVWSEMMQFVLTHYGVPPTDANDAQYHEAQQVAKTAGTRCTVPHGDALAQAVATRLANAQANAQSHGQTQRGAQGAQGAQAQGGSQHGTEPAGNPSRPGAGVPTDSLPADTSPSN